MNRRKESRAKTKLLCKFWNSENQIYEGKIRDLSKSGLKLVTKIEKFPLGVKSIELSFHVPISNIDVTIKAEIRWQRMAETNMETGLEFVNIKPMQKLDIGQYINQMLYVTGGTINERFGF